MLCFRLSTTLLLAAMCLLNAAVASVQKVITCDSGTAGKNVQRLSCVAGVIRVKSALYGRQDDNICSPPVVKGKLEEVSETVLELPGAPAQTVCSTSDTLDTLKDRCDGRKVCELNLEDVSKEDPCPGKSNYLNTTYGCFPAIPVTECEGSVAHLHCPYGRVIVVIGAHYGRTNQVTCSYGRPSAEVQQVDCFHSVTSIVSKSCNGKTSCTIDVSDSLDDDPCGKAWVSTYHYLEAAYTCQYSYQYYYGYRRHGGVHGGFGGNVGR